MARYEKGSAIPSIATLHRLIQACGHRLIMTTELNRLAPMGPPMCGFSARLLEVRINREATSIYWSTSISDLMELSL
ncbi:MAG: hypothetical protein ACREN8_05060 [Candidatus Dormibacteraceae bacterium]